MEPAPLPNCFVKLTTCGPVPPSDLRGNMSNLMQEIDLESLTPQVKNIVDPLVPRPRFKPRVACRGNHWFVSVSVAPKYRFDLDAQLSLQDVVIDVSHALESQGFAVTEEDVFNSDPDHVRWLVVSPDESQLTTVLDRRREWYSLRRPGSLQSRRV